MDKVNAGLYAGGVTCASFDALGQTVMTGGGDGSIFIHRVKGAPPKPSLPELPLDSSVLEDCDSPDSKSEQHEVRTWVQSIISFASLISFESTQWSAD